MDLEVSATGLVRLINELGACLSGPLALQVYYAGSYGKGRKARPTFHIRLTDEQLATIKSNVSDELLKSRYA